MLRQHPLYMLTFLINNWIEHFANQYFDGLNFNLQLPLSDVNPWPKFECNKGRFTLRGEVHWSWKKGVSQLWLVENATLDRWVFTLGEEYNGGELFSWMIKWHGPPTWRHFLELGFSGGRTRNSSSGEAQLNRNILLALILLRHIHHLPHIAMSWPSILDWP
jgi:hypothetical protein